MCVCVRVHNYLKRKLARVPFEDAHTLSNNTVICLPNLSAHVYYGVATVSRIDKIRFLFQNIVSFIGLFHQRPIILSILLTKATPYLTSVTCVYVYVCVCVYVCFCVYVCVCVCVYVCV